MTKPPAFYKKPATRKVLPGILFGLLVCTAACTNSMKEINEVMNKAHAGEDHGTDVTILYSKGGHISARLFAHTFVRVENAALPFTEMKDGLKVEFFNDSMRIKNILTARYARWYEREGNILIRDSVLIIDDKGEQLRTTELVWNQKLQQFFTVKPVQIKTPTQTLYGTGMEASQDFSSHTIHDLTGEVQVQKSQVPGE